MELAGIAAQQAIASSQIGIAVIKSQQQAEQAIVNLVAASVDSSRGQNLNISV